MTLQHQSLDQYHLYNPTPNILCLPGDDIPVKKQRRRATLLDLPVVIIIKILVYFLGDEYYPDTPPIQLLPILSTCKLLREIASSFLPDDAQWLNFFPVQPSKLKFCSYLSDISVAYTPDRLQIQNPQPHPQDCQNKQCMYVHRILAWYSHSGSSLRTLNLSCLHDYLPTKVACTLLHRLAKKDTPLQRLYLGAYQQQYVRKTMSLCESFKQLLPVISSTLQVLVLNTQYMWFVQAMGMYRMSALRKVHLIMDREIPAIDYDLEIVTTFLRHCEESHAEIVSLMIEGCAEHFSRLHSVLMYCPFVSELTLITVPKEGGQHGQFGFPKVEYLHCSRANNITIKGARIEEKEMNQLAQFVAKNRYVTQICFENCITRSLSDALMTYKHEFGNKITKIGLFPGQEIRQMDMLWDHKLVQTLPLYCPDLMSLSLWVYDSSDFVYISDFVKDSTHLRELSLRDYCVSIADEYSVKLLVESVLSTKAPIQTIKLENIFLPTMHAYKVMESCQESLRSFRILQFMTAQEGQQLHMKGSFDNYKDTLELLKTFYLNRAQFPQLYDFEIPLSLLPNLTADMKIERVAAKEMESLLTALHMEFNDVMIQNMMADLNNLLHPKP